MNIKKIQGNSLWINIICEAYSSIDPTWANFSGTWSIRDATTEKATGSLTPSTTAGTFYLRVPTSVMASLAVGTYVLTTQIKNASVDYEEERQDKLIINKPEYII